MYNENTLEMTNGLTVLLPSARYIQGNILFFLSLLPSLCYITNTALEVLEQDQVCTHTSKYVQMR